MDKEFLEKLYIKDGLTELQIADKLNISRGKVVYWRKKHEIKARPRGMHYSHKPTNWKGGKTKTNGYIMIYCPSHPSIKSDYIFEHRLVMEKYLGRYLRSDEVVHHKNRIRDDNRIENLELKNDQIEHMKEFVKNDYPKTSNGILLKNIMQEGLTWDQIAQKFKQLMENN